MFLGSSHVGNLVFTAHNVDSSQCINHPINEIPLDDSSDSNVENSSVDTIQDSMDVEDTARGNLALEENFYQMN